MGQAKVVEKGFGCHGVPDFSLSTPQIYTSTGMVKISQHLRCMRFYILLTILFIHITYLYICISIFVYLYRKAYKLPLCENRHLRNLMVWKESH